MTSPTPNSRRGAGRRCASCATASAYPALLSLTAVRMLPVAIATLGTRSSAPMANLGWFVPRGLASIVVAVLVVERASPG